MEIKNNNIASIQNEVPEDYIIELNSIIKSVSRKEKSNIIHNYIFFFLFIFLN